MSVSTKPILEAVDVTKTFRVRGTSKRLHACNGVTFAVRPGETLGIVGESGSGKTTLGRCLIGLATPDSGSIAIDGRDLAAVRRGELRKMRRDFQIVFQEPLDSLDPLMPIYRQVTEPLKVFERLSRRELHRRAVELLRRVALPAWVADALPAALSTGMQQRCAIARAISVEPKLIVLDEPTSALPPETKAEIIELLKDLQERLGLAYVFISHDLHLVKAVCDRVAVMYLGEIVELGDRSAIFDSPRHPYTKALMASALVPDAASRRRRESGGGRLRGEIPSPVDLPQGCFLATRCPYALERCRNERQALLEVGRAQLARCWRAADETQAMDLVQR